MVSGRWAERRLFSVLEKPFPASSGSMDAAHSCRPQADPKKREWLRKAVPSIGGVWPAGSLVYGVFSGQGTQRLRYGRSV